MNHPQSNKGKFSNLTDTARYTHTMVIIQCKILILLERTKRVLNLIEHLLRIYPEIRGELYSRSNQRQIIKVKVEVKKVRSKPQPFSSL